MKGRIGQRLSGLTSRLAFSRHSRAGGNDGVARKWFRRLIVVGALIAVYPSFVFATVYTHWFAASLPGGRNGPADAYRHTLASATVAYTSSPRLVAWVTAAMEHDGAGNDMRAMDAHNNQLGARIGSQARRWRDMHAAVRAAVDAGAIHAADADRVTWLPPERWQSRPY